MRAKAIQTSKAHAFLCSPESSDPCSPSFLITRPFPSPLKNTALGLLASLSPAMLLHVAQRLSPPRNRMTATSSPSGSFSPRQAEPLRPPAPLPRPGAHGHCPKMAVGPCPGAVMATRPPVPHQVSLAGLRFKGQIANQPN